MSDRSNAQIIAEARRQIAKYDDWHLSRPWIEELQGQIAYGIASDVVAALRAVVAALEAEGRLTPAVQGSGNSPQNSDEREALARHLEREFGAFLAHDPFDPTKFWGGAAGAILAAGFRRARDNWEYGREAPEDEGYESGIWLIDTPKVPVDGVTHRRRPPGEWEPIGG